MSNLKGRVCLWLLLVVPLSVVQQTVVGGKTSSRHVSRLRGPQPPILGVCAGNFEKQSETVSVKCCAITELLLWLSPPCHTLTAMSHTHRHVTHSPPCHTLATMSHTRRRVTHSPPCHKHTVHEVSSYLMWAVTGAALTTSLCSVNRPAVLHQLYVQVALIKYIRTSCSWTVNKRFYLTI